MSATALPVFGSPLLAAEANAQAAVPAYHGLGVAAAAAAIRRSEISAEAYAGALLSRARQNAGLTHSSRSTIGRSWPQPGPRTKRGLRAWTHRCSACRSASRTAI